MVENRDYFHTPLHSTSPLGGPRRNIAIQFGVERTRMVGLPDGERNFEVMCNRLDTIPACDGHTDGQTSCDGIVRAMRM